VNIGDWAVVRPYRDFAHYFLSKGSIGALTKSMAIELACRNPRIRVNAVLPGPVKMAAGISEQRVQKIVSECLLRREGTADDVAQAVLFLATSPFVTGICLPVDGGRSIYAGPSADPIAHPDVA
jgi:pteridine reductase